MAHICLQPPGPFNLRIPDEWPRWKRQFEQFREALGLGKPAEKKQISTLFYCLGEEAEVILYSTNTTAKERGDYDHALTKYDSFFQV